MSVEIKAPELGESVVEATVGRWLKREGEAVRASEPVVELETEKVNLEVPAPQTGVLERILRPEGETIRIGDTLGLISADGAVVSPQPERPPERAEVVFDRRSATPMARKLAAEQGIDVAEIRGSGAGGRITVEDVARQTEAALPAPEPGAEAKAAGPAVSVEALPPRRPGEAISVEQPAEPLRPPVSPAPVMEDRREERVRLSRRRLTIARRLLEAQRNSASLTTFNEIDLSAVQDLRRRRGEEFQKRHGIKLGLMSFFTKAAIGALKAFPQVNAELDGEELILKRYYDIGIAVSAEGGLVVPVVRDADRKSFAQIEREIEALATKAREGRLELSDLQGGTFTITNGGIFGSLMSTPILNYPQVGILGMHKIEERPVVVAGQIAIRPMMYVALTYDHRIVDGREAVQFLVTVKKLIEDPESLLLEG